MENTRPIIYNLNQKQLRATAVASVIMIALGIWLSFILKPHNYIAHYCFIGLGILCLALGIFMVVSFMSRAKGGKEGIIINNDGIIENVAGTGVPIIKWEDIKGIREEFVGLNKMIRIDVANAEEYIRQAKNASKRQMMKNQLRMSGSPFLISARSVSQKHNVLFDVMRTEFMKEKAKRGDQNGAAAEPKFTVVNDKPDFLDL